MSYALHGWLVLFLLGVARHTDQASGSKHEDALLVCIAQHSPPMALDLQLGQLRNAIAAIRVTMPIERSSHEQA